MNKFRKNVKPLNAGLQTYAAPWDAAAAAHLLRRTTFGPTLKEIQDATQEGLDRTLDRLLTDPRPPVSPPLNYTNTGDPTIPVGTTWVDKTYKHGDPENYRFQSMNGWYMQNILSHQQGIREKMNLFWINHFGMTEVIDHRVQYAHVALFYEFATGNFQELMERITVEPAMLQFLDGDVNNKDQPNENYARELLELYTVQKGPLIVTGDYSHYTESDVEALARILTGWRNDNTLFSTEETYVASYFDPEAHDTGSKQLSHYFNNRVVDNAGADEYKVLISIIMDHPETALGLCRELYRFFVYQDIPPEVDQRVIQPMAERLRQSNYELAPALRLLFSSEHFYDVSVRGSMIKNPYEFAVSTIRPLGGYDHLKLDLKLYYQVGAKISTSCDEMGMCYLDLPTVSGWRAYYDSPGYYRNWISPTTLQRRREFSDMISSGGLFVSEELLPVDWLELLKSLSIPTDAGKVVEDFVLLMLPRPLYPEQLAGLKEQLIENLPETEWSQLYSSYLSDPNNSTYRNLIETKLQRLLRAIFNLPEFQLQ